ncbi:hypothetical protein VTK56DRAFT_9653 [Thermocarpiscus australiensis]
MPIPRQRLPLYTLLHAVLSETVQFPGRQPAPIPQREEPDAEVAADLVALRRGDNTPPVTRLGQHVKAKLRSIGVVAILGKLHHRPTRTDTRMIRASPLAAAPSARRVQTVGLVLLQEPHIVQTHFARRARGKHLVGADGSEISHAGRVPERVGPGAPFVRRRAEVQQADMAGSGSGYDHLGGVLREEADREHVALPGRQVVPDVAAPTARRPGRRRNPG